MDSLTAYSDPNEWDSLETGSRQPQSLQQLEGCRSCALGELPEPRKKELWRQHREQGCPQEPLQSPALSMGTSPCEPQLSLCRTKLAFSASLLPVPHWKS